MTDRTQHITINIAGDIGSGKTLLTKIIKNALDEHGITTTISSPEHNEEYYKNASGIRDGLPIVRQRTEVILQDHNDHNPSRMGHYYREETVDDGSQTVDMQDSGEAQAETTIEEIKAQLPKENNSVGDLVEWDWNGIHTFYWNGKEWLLIKDNTPQDAMERLSISLHEDSAYAYSWQSNLAMPFYDVIQNAGLKDVIEENGGDLHALTNKAALWFMDIAFSYRPRDAQADDNSVDVQDGPLDEGDQDGPYGEKDILYPTAEAPRLYPQTHVQGYRDFFPLYYRSEGSSNERSVACYNVDVVGAMMSDHDSDEPDPALDLRVDGVHSLLVRAGDHAVSILEVGDNGVFESALVGETDHVVARGIVTRTQGRISFDYHRGNGTLNVYVDNPSERFSVLGIRLNGECH